MLTIRYGFIFFIGLSSASTVAETLNVKVLDQTAKGVPETVVYALSSPPESGSDQAYPEVVVDQIDKTFVNPVTVIRPGTSVIFPNHDNIRHHVYSFSPSKTFELPLYKDATPQPVRFDKPGEVALGCNIHDWMSAYIYVVDTPYSALTDAQGQTILTLPPGQYELHTWHSRIKKPEDHKGSNITIQAKQNAEVELAIVLKKSFRSIARTSGGFDGGTYR
ncbi:MAG: methylamine utilization protein [Methylovulum sp.]|nr:methylamine utilization protein [Methylovulum sp.]